jgi:hypothetical protein
MRLHLLSLHELTNVQEASEAEMTVHDDDPKYFEFFLKFMYTHQYDKATIIKLAAGDKYARIRIPVAIHAVADKYDMLLLLEPIAKDVEELLAGEIQSCPDIVVALIKTYYETMPSVGSPLGKILVSKIQTNSDNYCGTDEFVDLMKAYPIFGADVALSMTNLLCPLLVPYTCGACKFAGGVNRAGLRAKGKWVYYCESCGSQRNLT